MGVPHGTIHFYRWIFHGKPSSSWGIPGIPHVRVFPYVPPVLQAAPGQPSGADVTDAAVFFDVGGLFFVEARRPQGEPAEVVGS